MPWLELGYVGLFLATFLAATIVPFSSEAILAGMLTAEFDPWICLAVATLGNTAGGMSSYYIGYLANWRILSRWLRVSEDAVTAWKTRSERFGAYLAFLCWLPFIGDVVAVALGVFRVSPLKVGIWMLLGKFLRYLFIVEIMTAF